MDAPSQMGMGSRPSAWISTPSPIRIVVPGTRNETPTKDSPNAETEAMAKADSGWARAMWSSQLATSWIQAKKPCISGTSEVEGSESGSGLHVRYEGANHPGQ